MRRKFNSKCVKLFTSDNDVTKAYRSLDPLNNCLIIVINFEIDSHFNQGEIKREDYQASSYASQP
jgi:hypothetical protein